MTLNSAERARTRDELAANLRLSGLTDAEMVAGLGYTADRLRTALEVAEDSDPVDVWELRDYLIAAVRENGHEPVAFTVLTDRSRRQAQRWFALRDVPPPLRRPGARADDQPRRHH